MMCLYDVSILNVNKHRVDLTSR